MLATDPASRAPRPAPSAAPALLSPQGRYRAAVAGVTLTYRRARGGTYRIDVAISARSTVVWRDLQQSFRAIFTAHGEVTYLPPNPAIGRADGTYSVPARRLPDLMVWAEGMLDDDAIRGDAVPT